MKRSLVGTIGLATLFLSVAAVALAGGRDHRTCSIASVKGEWGYSESGTLYHPVLGALPYASVGSYTVDHDGNLSGARNASVGSTGVQFATIQGTATVNPDCTGELHLKFFTESGDLLNTAIKFVVYVNDSTEARALITDVVLPDDTTHLKAVLVTDAKKQFPDRSGEHDR